MLQVHENQISLRKCFSGTAQFAHLRGKIGLSLACSYRYSKDGVPQEKFLGIYEFQKFDAKFISERMLSILYENDLRKLLAQRYDGALVMSGNHGGVQALIS